MILKICEFFEPRAINDPIRLLIRESIRAIRCRGQKGPEQHEKARPHRPPLERERHEVRAELRQDLEKDLGVDSTP